MSQKSTAPALAHSDELAAPHTMTPPRRLKVNQHKTVTRPFETEIGGELLAGEYRPAVVTFAWSRSLQNIEKAEQPDKEIVQKILSAVDSWDLEYEPGQPVPLTEDALMDVPTDILLAVIGEVANAGLPGEATAGQTPAPSANFSSNAPE